MTEGSREEVLIKPSKVKKESVGSTLGEKRSETASRASQENDQNSGLESSTLRRMSRVVAFAPVVEERVR